MRKVLFSCTLSVFCLISMVAPAEDDILYLECKDHPRGPWCYQEAVEQLNQPELCENILKYWPRADGVHGWCYYQLAMKNKDCNLCNKIRKADIKKMCRLDVCK